MTACGVRRVGDIRKAISIAASQQVASGLHSTIVTNDWFDFLSALLAARVRFLVVGAPADALGTTASDLITPGKELGDIEALGAQV